MEYLGQWRRRYVGGTRGPVWVRGSAGVGSRSGSGSGGNRGGSESSGGGFARHGDGLNDNDNVMKLNDKKYRF